MTEEVDTINSGAPLGKIDLSGLDIPLFRPQAIQPMPIRVTIPKKHRIGELEMALRAILVLAADDGGYSASGALRSIKRIIETVPGFESKA